jgi:hypothetical protein
VLILRISCDFRCWRASTNVCEPGFRSRFVRERAFHPLNQSVVPARAGRRQNEVKGNQEVCRRSGGTELRLIVNYGRWTKRCADVRTAPNHGGQPSPEGTNAFSNLLGLAGVPAVVPASAGRRLEARGVGPLFPAPMSSNVHGCFIRAISEANTFQ